MADPIKLRPQFDYSNTAGAAPSRPLLPGGAAIQQADGLLYTLRADGTLRATPLDSVPGGNVLTGKAAVVTGGHKVLFSRPDGSGLAAASSADTTQAGRIVGLSLNAALANAPITYVATGVVDEPSWSWTPGTVFLGADGNPTQSVPSAGFIQPIGISPSPTKLNVSLGPFIIL